VTNLPSITDDATAGILADPRAAGPTQRTVGEETGLDTAPFMAKQTIDTLSSIAENNTGP